MTATPPRRLALATLRAVRRGELLDRAAAGALARLGPRDRGWFHELVYGTVRLRGRLDWLLEQRVRRGLRSLRPDVLDVLRLGAYQLLEMDSVPTYAAVSESVELARHAAGEGAAGLVNGVLKALSRDEEGAGWPSFERDPVEHLSTWGSHPRWLVERWVERFGATDARALVELDNRRPELFYRPVGVAVAEAVERLERADIGAEQLDFAPDVVRLAPGTDPTRALSVLPGVVQDAAASLVTRYAALPAAGPVADACAAPGGKAVGLADRPRLVVALDASPQRIRLVASGAARLEGLAGRIAPVVADARRPPLRPLGGVLVDAPCSGTGTLRRHPDGKWRLRAEDLRTLARLQREILDGLADRVAAGGVLVYATCSLEPEENEEQVDSFLERRPDFTLEAPDGVAPEVLDERGRLRVLPQRFGADGAFAARLRRRAG